MKKKKKSFSGLIKERHKKERLMFLAGDIGGTKSRLALFTYDKEIKIIKEERFQSDNFTSLNAVLRKFLSGQKEKIEAACFGLPGPVREGRCQTTNLPWIIVADELAEDLQAEVFLINDLVSNAYGIERLSDNELYVLNEGIPNQAGNAALISAGTGLGQAGLFWDGKRHIPFACEGGHSDFGAKDELEIELLRYLQRKYGHVSFERMVSGPGLHNIYQFLVDTMRELRLHSIEMLFLKGDPGRVITEKAMNSEVRGCEMALELFISLYGAEAGNLALKIFAINGIFLGGGMAPRILEKLKEGSFMRTFADKGRFSSLMKTIPVKVIMNPRTALLGAEQYLILKKEGKV